MKAKRLFLTFAAILASVTLFAQDNLIGGRWQSQNINVDTENMVMEYFFKDETNLEMSFITDNYVPNTGRLVSRISAQGTYTFAGPICFVSVDQSTIAVEVKDLQLEGELADQFSSSQMPELKKAFTAQIKQMAQALFVGFDNVSMIYVSNPDNPDEFSFVIGDENEAMSLDFKRVK